ncbi:DNA adenine methylase [Microbulbifer sp. JMSA004]|uniref:DNA adenine methylase n=1 Tax=Microbulbifer sp. JMSA004 TaxID=3243370 RepID=UPI004039CBE8
MTVPFLRWAGGKRWLAKDLAPLISKVLKRRYIEPFLGGGALFFELQPRRAYLSDLNEDLICTYRVLKKSPVELLSRLKEIESSKDVYYTVRASRPDHDLEKAIRFLYLNRNCYGGIYRENKKGDFNVPFGGGQRNHKCLWEKGLLVASSTVLCKSQVLIASGDFEVSVKSAGQGDVVYCDPTYRNSSRSQFDRYGASVFDWDDQVRLARAAREAAGRGAVVIVSNAFCSDVAELYPDALKLELKKSKSLGNAPKDLTKNKEFLFVLDPLGRIDHWCSLYPKNGMKINELASLGAG